MATYINKLIVIDEGKLQKIGAADDLEIGGGLDVGGALAADALNITNDVEIGGNLNVQGAIVSHGSENLMVSDPYIGLASNNTAATATSGGFTLTLKKATDFVALTAETFVAGVPGTSAPTVTLATGEGATLAAGDIIQISGAANQVNNGLHVVASVASNVVTIYGIGGTAVPAYAKFIDNQFAAESGASATVVKVDLAVLAISDGNLYEGASAFPVGTPCYAYFADATLSDFDGGWSEFGGDVSLQEAYEAGNSIQMTAAQGNFSVAPAASETVAISLEASASSKFEVVGNSLNLTTSGGVGNVNVTAAQQFSVSAGDNVTINSSTGDIQIGNSFSGVMNLGTGTSNKITIGSPNASEVEVRADLIDIGSDGAVTLAAAGASNFTVANNSLTLSTTGSGALEVSGGGNVTVVATGANSTVAVNADDGDILIGNEDVDHDIKIGGAGERDINIGSVSATSVTVDAVSVSIDATSGSNMTVTGAQLALGTSGSGALVLTSAGLMDVNAGADLDIDVTGSFDVLATGAISIDGTGNSNLSVTTGNLTLGTGSGALSMGTLGGAFTLYGTSESNIYTTGIAQALNIQGGAGTGALNLATGGAHQVNIGNSGNYSQKVYIYGGNQNVAGIWLTTYAVDASTKAPIEIVSGGDLKLWSSNGDINMGTNAVAQSINIGTGAAARTVTLGNNTGASKLMFDTGSGGAEFDVDGPFAINVNNASTGTFNLTVVDNDINFTTTTSGSFNVKMATSAELNALDGGYIGIGNLGSASYDNAEVRIGTAGERTVIIGNTTGAMAVDILAGTGGVDITGNVNLTGYLAATSYLKVGEVAGGSFPTPAGSGALLWDSTSNKLKYYDASTPAWKTFATADGVTLQVAYDNGASAAIELSDARNLVVSPGASATAAISLNANDDSDFTVEDADLTIATTGTSGTLNLGAAGAFNVSGFAESGVTVTGFNLHLVTATSGDIMVSSADAITMTADSASLTAAAGNIVIDATGAVEIDATANSHFSVPGGELALYSSGDLSINSGAALNIGTLDVAQPINIGTDGDRTITIGQSAGGSKLELYSKNAEMVIDATGQTLNVDAATVDVASTGSATHTVAANGSLSVVTGATTKFVVGNSVEHGAFVSHNLSATAATNSLGAAGLFYNIGTALTTGVQAGHVLYLADDGVMKKADNATNKEVVGVSATVAGASTTYGSVVSMPGSITLVKFASAPSAVGSPVYLSATAGLATQTVPSSGRVFKLGILQSTSSPGLNLYAVLWMPQFIADL